MVTQLSAPLNTQWELTAWCNHHCIYCYNYWKADKTAFRARLTKAELVRQQRVADELVLNRVFHTTLTGGEPLAVIEQMESILRGAVDSGLYLGLNSNLVLLNDRRARLLRELGVRSVLTSLMSADESLTDCLTQQQGAFRQITKGIELAVASGFGVVVNMVVTKVNYHSILETGRLAKDLGAQGFAATKASTPSNCHDFSQYRLNADEIRVMFDQLLEIRARFGLVVDTLEPHPACAFHSSEARSVFGRRNCTAGKTNCTIGFDGLVRPCSHVPNAYGNIFEGLQEAWNAMGVWRDGSLVPEKCKQVCGEYPRRCGSGCRGEAKAINGSLSSPDPMCLGRRPKHKKPKKLDNLLSAESRVVLANGVRFRPESFGYIAYRSASNWLAMDQQLHDMLIATALGGYIGADAIKQAYGATESAARSTITKLVTKKIAKLVQ